MSIDRGNSKHGPRLDEQMAQEVKGEARVEEWREPEPPGDGQPDSGWTPQGHHGFPSGDDRDPDRREERARVGSYLTRTVFPADRAALLEAAQGNRAPDEVIDVLNDLPPDATYPNMRELWIALGLLSDR
jgi:Protein of unknown function (DUF2795)